MRVDLELRCATLVEHCSILESKQATRREHIELHLEYIYEDVPNNEVVFSLVGHGSTIQSKSYLDLESIASSTQAILFDWRITSRPVEVVAMLSRLRRGRSTRIVVLSTKESEQDACLLAAGADDVVPRSVSPAVMVARIRALLRSGELGDSGLATKLRFDNLQLDLTRVEAVVGRRPLQLKLTSFKILALLMSDPQRVFTRREILHHVSQDEAGELNIRNVDVHVGRIRAELREDGRMIRTVRRVGYTLNQHSQK